MKFTIFLAEEALRLAAFKRWWEYNNAEFPGEFPMDLNSGDWDEQLQGFEYDPSTHTCGDTGWVKLSSMNKRLCNICDREYPWKLKPGDIPVMAGNRLKSPTQLGD